MKKKLFCFLPVAGLLWFISSQNYLLFHSLADFWAIGIALLAGYVGLSTYSYTRNSLVAGLGFLFLSMAALDLLHCLAYRGMGVFPSFTADQPTQLWILARLIQSLGFLCVLLFHRRRNFVTGFGIVLGCVSAVGVTCVFNGLFPVCIIPGVGPTSFRIWSELIVSLTLLLGTFAVLRTADPAVLPYRKVFVITTLLSIGSEVCFSLYGDVYGVMNMVGHLFKVASFWVMLDGFLFPSVRDPLFTLFNPFLSDRGDLLAAMSGPSGILDEAGKVIAGNKHLQTRDSGYVGKSLPSVVNLLPGVGELILSELDHVVKTGFSRHFEFRDMGKDYLAGLYPMCAGQSRDLRQYSLLVRNVTRQKRAEADLATKSEALLEAQEMALLGTFRVKILSGEVYCSRSLRALFGFSHEDDIDFQWYLDHIHEEDRARVEAIRQAAWKSGKENYRFECRIRRVDDVVRHFRVWARGSRDGEGRVIELVGTFQDVTDHVFLRRELQVSEERYRSYIEMAPIGVIVVDDDGKLVEVNRADSTMTGYEREELLGMDVADLYPSDQREAARERFRRLRSEGPKTFEAHFLRRDGTRGFWKVIAVPLPDGTYMGLVQDLSERNEALEKVRLSQERFKTLFDTIMEGFGIHEAILDKEGDLFDYRFLEVNPAFEELTGLSAQAILGKTARDVFNDLEGHWFETYREVVRTGESVRFRGFAAELGRWYEVLAFPMGEDRFATAFRDVSREQAHEEALDKAHRELEAHVTKLEKAWEQTIRVFAEITEFRDPYTSGHQRCVAAITEAVCREMGFDEAATSETVLAALVHDIGKITIPSDFLSKPGRLSEKEFRIIRKHPQVAVELLKGIDLPWPLAEIVGQHHERMDGSGYPLGLKGDEILMQARIIAVADVVEAMASDRPYRASLGIGAALEEVEKGAGVWYDAEVASACFRLFREKGYILPDQV